MADSTTTSNPSPDEALAAVITEAISAAKLVKAEKLPRIRNGLANGTLTAADWKLLAELALPPEEGGDLS